MKSFQRSISTRIPYKRRTKNLGWSHR